MAMIARPERSAGFQPYNAASNNLGGKTREGTGSLIWGRKRMDEAAEWVKEKMEPDGRVGVTKPDTSGADVEIRGHLIPKEIADANSVPEWLAVWDEGCREWNVGAAKLRMLVKIYRPIILGKAFGWDEDARGGNQTDMETGGMAAQAAEEIVKAES